MTPRELALLAVAVLLGAAAVWLFWAWRRTRAELAVAQAGRARALRTREQAAELAVAAERLRILREMHDVIAHSLAIMIAQADGGSYVTADTAAAKRAFLTIAETGRVALADTRRILGVLRHGEAAELAPVPTHASLDELVEQARQAGLVVSLIRVGEARPLPSASRMALYRICQEALTNVIKHAGEGVKVVVTLSWTPEAVTMTITDRDGDGSPAGNPALEEQLAALGLGLIGMRERAELVGGSLEAGPTEDGFRVRTELPLDGIEGEVA